MNLSPATPWTHGEVLSRKGSSLEKVLKVRQSEISDTRYSPGGCPIAVHCETEVRQSESVILSQATNAVSG